MFDLICLGTPLMDKFAFAEKKFLKDNKLIAGSCNFINKKKIELLEKQVTIIKKYPGDNARNVCESYKHLNKKAKVGYAGIIGKDENARLIRKNLKQIGVASFLQEQGKNTSEILCLITGDKNRTFAADIEIEHAHFDRKLPRAKWFFCTSITLLYDKPIAKSAMKNLLEQKKKGAKIAISFESAEMLERNREKALEIAKLADAVFLNDEETKALDLNSKTIAKLSKTVFVKKGKKGSIVFSNGKEIAKAKALKVKKVIDTTGAGDAYCAGVLSGLSKNKSLKECALIGNKIAAKVIQQVGSTLGQGE